MLLYGQLPQYSKFIIICDFSIETDQRYLVTQLEFVLDLSISNGKYSVNKGMLPIKHGLF